MKLKLELENIDEVQAQALNKLFNNLRVITMSKVIGAVNIQPSIVEGTPTEVATHIFQNIICPSTEMLIKQDPQAAMLFAYHIMGFGISQYAECVSTKQFKKQLDVITHNMVQRLKKERGELES